MFYSGFFQVFRIHGFFYFKNHLNGSHTNNDNNKINKFTLFGLTFFDNEINMKEY